MSPAHGSAIELQWVSDGITHRDRLAVPGVEPESLRQKLRVIGWVDGERLALGAPRIELEAGHDAIDSRITPVPGRHYPARIVRAPLPDEARGPVLRCVAAGPGSYRFDAAHPLAAFDPEFRIEPVHFDPTGTVEDPARWLAVGPGLQARRPPPLEWLHRAALAREDESDDARFYAAPRFVTHVDARAVETISSVYGRLVPPGARLLDLMSSWISHLPESLPLGAVTGLGMNAEELAANPRLDRAVTHDLNRNPALPFESASFDAVVCSVSIEYLADPLAVIGEVARVLAPGGVFVATFSNRCFPTKAIRIWNELHEFERMGLVVDLLRRDPRWRATHTWSQRGLPPVPGDTTSGTPGVGDPVYAVWATTEA